MAASGRELRCKTDPYVRMPLVPLASDSTLRLNASLLCVDWIRDWTDLVVAGGHVLNAVLDDAAASERGDVDLFFVSPSAVDMRAKCALLHRWLLEHYERAPSVNVKGSSVRFYVPDARASSVSPGTRVALRLQVIFLRRFDSVSALLATFDLNNCQFALQNQRVHATVGALRYLDTKQILYYNPNCDVRRAARMLKYQSRVYNRIVHVHECPQGCSADNLMDYNRVPADRLCEYRALGDWNAPVALEVALAFVPESA